MSVLKERGAQWVLSGIVGIMISCSASISIAANTQNKTNDDYAVHDRFIIRYKASSPERRNSRFRDAALKSTSSDFSLQTRRSIQLAHVRRLANDAEIVQSDRELTSDETAQLLRTLRSDPNVEYVEIDQEMHPAIAVNDRFYIDGSQWPLYDDSPGGINLKETWGKTAGEGIIVAVLDTGIVDHPDLNANILPGYDLITETWRARDNDSRDPDPTDPGDWSDGIQCEASTSTWHGTHVAGIIASVGDNGIGTIGVAPRAKILPVRVLGKCGGRVSDIVDGIIWSAGGSIAGVPDNPYPAHIINLSLGGVGTCSQSYQEAIDQAVALGSIVVTAAGNGNTDVELFQPANCSNVITVASTDETGSKSTTSNYGARIDIAAPGTHIRSAGNPGIYDALPYDENTSYLSKSGTSLAASHVSGALALMLSTTDSSTLPNSVVLGVMEGTARPLPGQCREGCGYGIVNTSDAVDFLMSIFGVTVPIVEPEVPLSPPRPPVL